MDRRIVLALVLCLLALKARAASTQPINMGSTENMQFCVTYSTTSNKVSIDFWEKMWVSTRAYVQRPGFPQGNLVDIKWTECHRTSYSLVNAYENFKNYLHPEIIVRNRFGYSKTAEEEICGKLLGEHDWVDDKDVELYFRKEKFYMKSMESRVFECTRCGVKKSITRKRGYDGVDYIEREDFVR